MRKEEPEFPDEAKERAAEAAARFKAIAIEIKKERKKRESISVNSNY